MKAGKLGVLSAITASACCLGPAALAAVGLGGLGAGIFLVRYSGWLVGLAVVLLALGWRIYLAEAKRCKAAQCLMPGSVSVLTILLVASVVVAGFALMHLGPLFFKAACAISCPRPL